MQKVENLACPYQGSTRDDALRKFFQCEKWKKDREEFEGEVWPMILDSVVKTMLSGGDH